MQDDTSRRLTTILAADVVGFSRLVAADEEGTLTRLGVQRAAFAELIGKSHGRIFNTAGDAIRAEFQSALDAVRCARALQVRSAELGAEDAGTGGGDARRIRWRIGVALGDVVESGGDLLGDGVSLAETLEAAAQAGGIAVSRAVHDAVAGKAGIAFAALAGVVRDGAALPAYAADAAALGAGGAGSAAGGNTNGRAGGMTGSNDARGGTNAGGAGEPKSAGRGGWLWLGGLGLATFIAVFAGMRLMQRPAGPAKSAPEPKAASPTVTSPAATATAKPAGSADKGGGSAAVAPSSGTPAGASPSTSPSSSGGSVSPAAPGGKPASAAGGGAPAATAAATPPLRDDAGAGPSFARQWQDCAKADGATQIAACKALLDSPGKLSDADLGTLNHHLGRAELQKGDIEPAIAALSISVDKAPTADAYVARGIAYHQKGDLEAAVRDFSEALRRDANNGEALNNRAWSRYKLKQLKEAMSDADAAVKVLSGKSYAWDTRGHINEALGNKAAAIADYKRAVELDANARDSLDGLKRLGAAP